MKKTILFLAAMVCSLAAVAQVTSADQVDAQKCYSIKCVRGALTITDASATHLVGTYEGGVSQTIDASNPLQQFAFVNYDGHLYLYSVGAGKFVNIGTEDKGSLDAAPVNPIEFVTVNSSAARLRFDALHNINLGGSKQVVIDDWNTADDGNRFTIAVAGDFDTEAIVASIEEGKAQAERDQRWRPILEQAQQLDRHAYSYTTEGMGYIYQESQLSSDYTHESEGSLAALIDNDPTTYWHSKYVSGQAVELHTQWFQVALDAPVEGTLVGTMTAKQDAQGNVELLGVETSQDGLVWTPAGQMFFAFDDPATSSETRTGAITLTEPAQYFRFFCDRNVGSLQNGWMNIAEFQLNGGHISSTCPAGVNAEATALFRSIVASAALNTKPSEADITALQEAIAAFQAATTPTTLPEGWSPCSVSDLEGAWAASEGKVNVTLSFTAPSQMEDMNWHHEDLTLPITKITISRCAAGDWMNIQQVGEITNATPGAALTYTDEDVAYGMYDYYVKVFVGEAESFDEMLNGFAVGEFAMPGDIEISVTGSSVSVQVEPAVFNTNFESLSTPVVSLQIGELDMYSGEVGVVSTVNNPSASEATIVNLNNVAEGKHTYAVRVATYAGYSDWTYYTGDVYVGQDQPGMVENIQVTTNAEGAYVVTWEAPSAGLNGGDQGDLNAITYTVKRGTDENDLNAVTLAEGIKELSVTDTPAFTEETVFCYIITASNAKGEGYPACSEQIVAGPAAALPFTENFDTPFEDMWTTADHLSWSRTTTGFFCAWTVGSSSYVDNVDVKPHNGAGLLYAYYGWGSMSCTDDYTSGRIDFSSATTPCMSFWYYDVAASEPTDVVLSVEVSTDGENFTATDFQHTMGTATTTGWHQAIVPLTALAGAAEGRVRFHNDNGGTNMLPVTIDEIRIEATTIDGIHSLSTQRTDAATYDLQGRMMTAPQSAQRAHGLYIKNGQKVLR